MSGRQPFIIWYEMVLHGMVSIIWCYHLVRGGIYSAIENYLAADGIPYKTIFSLVTPYCGITYYMKCRVVAYGNRYAGMVWYDAQYSGIFNNMVNSIV